MKYLILACGRLRNTLEEKMLDRYLKRFSTPPEIVEIVSKKHREAAQTQEWESQQICTLLRPDDCVVVLDERGKDMTTAAFAQFIQTIQISSTKRIVFCLGGADGHTAAVRQRATCLMRMGQLTWPHKLARVMLIEQLYRAQQILAGHPYHRDS